MQCAQLPDDENLRIVELYGLMMLDTAAERGLDKFVEFVSAEFNVPIALISLVDRHRQWFKAKVGISACETSRDVSFCAHAILQDDLMVVEDTSNDQRFADNPLVLGPPHIRFYAGAVLRSNGYALGTLCIIDTRPRRFTAEEGALLLKVRDLALVLIGAAAEGPANDILRPPH